MVSPHTPNHTHRHGVRLVHANSPLMPSPELLLELKRFLALEGGVPACAPSCGVRRRRMPCLHTKLNTDPHKILQSVRTRGAHGDIGHYCVQAQRATLVYTRTWTYLALMRGHGVTGSKAGLLTAMCPSGRNGAMSGARGTSTTPLHQLRACSHTTGARTEVQG
jgi:hypothetical protein